MEKLIQLKKDKIEFDKKYTTHYSMILPVNIESWNKIEWAEYLRDKEQIPDKTLLLFEKLDLFIFTEEDIENFFEFGGIIAHERLNHFLSSHDSQ
jgi:hypothetical protein